MSAIASQLPGLTRALWRVVLPHRCESCLQEADAWLCDTCLATLQQEAAAAMCDCCGYPLVLPGDPCPHCLHRPGRLIRRSLRLCLHDGVAKEMVLRLKFARHWSLAPHLAKLLYVRPEIRDLLDHCDALVPIPLHWWRYWRRGFNQSGLLAAELSRLAGRPTLRLLARRRQTQAQSTLHSITARARNMKDAFAPRPRIPTVAGRRLLLIDDVTTTGATLRAAARALHQLHPAEVHALTFTMADPR